MREWAPERANPPTLDPSCEDEQKTAPYTRQADWIIVFFTRIVKEAIREGLERKKNNNIEETKLWGCIKKIEYYYIQVIMNTGNFWVFAHRQNQRPEQ